MNLKWPRQSCYIAAPSYTQLHSTAGMLYLQYRLLGGIDPRVGTLCRWLQRAAGHRAWRQWRAGCRYAWGLRRVCATHADTALALSACAVTDTPCAACADESAHARPLSITRRVGVTSRLFFSAFKQRGFRSLLIAASHRRVLDLSS